MTVYRIFADVSIFNCRNAVARLEVDICGKPHHISPQRLESF